MAIKLINSVERKKNKKGELESTYYDENGNITTDENKIKNIEREIKLNLGGKHYIGGHNGAISEPLTREEYEAAKALLYPEMDTKEGIINENVKKAVETIKNAEVAPQIQKEQEVANLLNEKGAFKESSEPQNLKEPLNINEETLLPNFNIPSLSAKASERVLNYIDLSAIKNMSFEEFANTPEYQNSETLKSLIKNELDMAIFKSGEARVSSLGALVEGIPLISGLARKYGGNLLETPSSKIDTIVKELSSLEGDIREQGNAATAGANPSIILDNMNAYEERILWLEGKLKFLIAQSAEMRSNPEEIDLIMTQIKGIYNRINDTRKKVSLSQIQQVESSTLKDFSLLQKYKKYLNT
jgi:hypothetical protein